MLKASIGTLELIKDLSQLFFVREEAYTRTAFADDTIPLSRVNAIGAAVLNLYPLPNVNTTAFQSNYIANIPAVYGYDQEMARVDDNISDRTRIYSLFAYQGGHETQSSNGFPSPATYGSINVKHQQITASQDLTHTFTPTTLLDLKVSQARYYLSSPDVDLADSVNASTIGLTVPSIPTTSLKQLPEFTTPQFYPQVVGNVITSGTYTDISLNGELTKQWGKHALHFGDEYHHLDHGTPGQAGHANGDFAFGTFAPNKVWEVGRSSPFTSDAKLGPPSPRRHGPRTARRTPLRHKSSRSSQ